MTTIRLRKPGGLENLWVDREAPATRVPRAGEIRVHIRANSLNYHDYLVVAGKSPVDDGRIPMSDASGEVVEVGPGVTEFAVGDHVISTFFPDWLAGGPTGGGFAGVPGDGKDGYARETVVAPVSAFTRAPSGFTHEEAATLPCAALTAWRALIVEGGLKPGDTVLVQGTGGVSIFALQIAKRIGATVVATSSSDEKLERLAAMGADHLVNYRKTERWGAAAKMLVGRGLDHVVEVGGAGTLAQSISACREGGHVAVIGILSGVSANVPVVSIMAKQLRITGLTVGNRNQQIDMVRGFERMGLKPIIDRGFPLEAIAEAFRRQEECRHFGKIVLTV